MLEVTFIGYSKVFKKWFENVEIHKSVDDARLRALALNWQIKSIKIIKE